MWLERARVGALVLALVTGMVIASCASTEPDQTASSTSMSEELSTSVYVSGSELSKPGLYPVRCDGKWGYIDNIGHVVLEYLYDDADDFYDGMAAVRIGDMWGYIDELGEMVVPAQWYRVGHFVDGLAPVYSRDWSVDKEAADLTSYISKTGKIVLEPTGEWSSGNEFGEGLAPVWLRTGGCGYINTLGEVVLRLPEATVVRRFSEGLAAVRDEGGYWGYIDRDGDTIVEFKYTAATEYSGGIAVVESVAQGHGYPYHTYSVIDGDGQVLCEPEYQQVLGFREGLAPVARGGEWQAMKEGSDLSTAGLPKWGYMSRAGNMIIPAQFEYARPYRGGIALVDIEGSKIAYVDLEGNFVWQEK